MGKLSGFLSLLLANRQANSVSPAQLACCTERTPLLSSRQDPAGKERKRTRMMDRNPRTNPGLLKLDLYCKGMRIDDSCNRLDKDGRPILRTRAGLGSGLEILLPDNLWTNVPVLESFAQDSPYSLHDESGRYTIRFNGEAICTVTLPEKPNWYDQTTSSGKIMSRIGVLQGTYLGVYPTDVCHYWTLAPRENCSFCSVGLNLGTGEDTDKKVQDVVETVQAARRESRITYVHFNTGYYEGDTYLDQLEPFIAEVKRTTGLLIGVQTPPHPDLSRYRRLRKLGVNQVSFCFEFWNREVFQELCPGKSRFVGLDRYLEAIRYCAPIFDTTNGEIIAGIEPIEDTLAAIEWITDVGAIPTVCVFRPLKGIRDENRPPPDTESLIPVFARLYDACMEKGLPVGIAPNIEVSIILKPEEGRYFSDRRHQFRWREKKLRVMHYLFKGLFKTQVLRAKLRAETGKK